MAALRSALESRLDISAIGNVGRSFGGIANALSEKLLVPSTVDTFVEAQACSTGCALQRKVGIRMRMSI